jgi:hypothetical protein
MSRYVYQPLIWDDSIHMLILEPGCGDDLIRCRLVERRLAWVSDMDEEGMSQDFWSDHNHCSPFHSGIARPYWQHRIKVG